MSIDFEAIKAAVSITDVLADTGVKVSHRDTFRTTCPLHNGDGPNFSVDLRKGFWHCFVCHLGGDVIKLKALLENCSNVEAARMLAGDYNVEAEERNELRAGVRKLTRAVESWRSRQEEPPPFTGEIPITVELPELRGYSREAINHYGLRLIPGSGWGTGVYIPVHDAAGVLVGYSIRHADGLTFADGRPAPKYINTAGLDKRKLLFGLHQNAGYIEEKSEAVLVEGQLDAISIWDRGLRNVVGIMGSSLSPEQARLLMRHATRLVLMLDGDLAGRVGSIEIGFKLASCFDIRRIRLPEGVDPDTADLKDLAV